MRTDAVRRVDLRNNRDAGRLGLSRGRRERSGVLQRRRQHERVDHLAQRVQLDQHVLDVALEAHVIARLELLFAEDAERREQLARLLRDELLQALPACGAGSSRPRFSASFTHSLGVVVALEANGAPSP